MHIDIVVAFGSDKDKCSTQLSSLTFSPITLVVQDGTSRSSTLSDCVTFKGHGKRDIKTSMFT